MAGLLDIGGQQKAASGSARAVRRWAGMAALEGSASFAFVAIVAIFRVVLFHRWVKTPVSTYE
jgi:hypothetical protein